jgi:hypothetical protein
MRAVPFGEALHVVEHSMIPQLLLPTVSAAPADALGWHR